MCGRLNVSDNEGVRLLLESFGMTTWPARDPQWNIAPTQSLDVVVENDTRELVPMSWGYSLSLPGKSGKRVIKRVSNTRSDKIWTSPMWQRSIAQRRALVPVNGFYEWKRKGGKPVGAYYMEPAHTQAMFLAGIYQDTRDADARPEVSIVTTDANREMSALHHRMPVVLTSLNAASAWLRQDDRETLDVLMQPADDGALTVTRVSDYVNNSRHEGPDCTEALNSNDKTDNSEE